MTSSHQSLPHTPNLAANPVPAPLLLYLSLLGWLAVASIGAGIGSLFLPPAWPEAVRSFVVVALLAGLVLIPVAGFAGLARWRRWNSLLPLALLGAGLYLLADITIRAVAGPPSGEGSYERPALETILRLTLLVPAAALLGSAALWRAGLRSRRELAAALGLTGPPVAAMLLALAFVALLTLGWPLTGALGDRWTSQLILIQTLALILPEELFFRGAVLGLLLAHLPQRRALAALLALLTYLALTPSLIIPHGDWGKLVWLVTAAPLTWLLLELRLSSGSLWPGVLLAGCYRAAPLLFTDPRDEFPLLTQPWQTGARLWMLLGAGGLALLWWAGRCWLAQHRRPTILTRIGAALAMALSGWAVWLGLWFTAGYPGFYDDGFLIIMAEQADLSGAEQIGDLVARRAFVRQRLIETAQRSQAPVRRALEAAGLPYRPFYLINMIRVEGHHRRMAEFAGLPGVARLMLNPNVRPYPFNFDLGYGDAPAEGQGVAWNIRRVKADQVWDMGFTGQGIVVAGQDTGYDWQHPALRRAYRGAGATGQVNHNYNWHDAWDDTPAPFDDGRHGTHTMGTILGDGGQGNQIGLAPGAAWIGCRNMRRGLGNPASYTDCMEFFLAPYPPGGDPFSEGDVSLAPHVVNNSWGCPGIEGCDDSVLEPALAALHAAGIMMVVSAGNGGPACETVADPPARYDEVFSVGATDEAGLITAFSSRGPVPAAGANSRSPLLKPDITAPGDNIRSSLPGGGYGAASGTSMAGPHVTGLVALIWSANPALIGQIEATEQIIRRSARRIEVNAACALDPTATPQPALLEGLEAGETGKACACGGVSGSPNNVYGWGEIDALAAVKLALASR